MHGAQTFLDTKTKRKEDVQLTVLVNRKPTHTHINFQSNHNVQHKLVSFRTHFHRAGSVIKDVGNLKKETTHTEGEGELSGHEVTHNGPSEKQCNPDKSLKHLTDT